MDSNSRVNEQTPQRSATAAVRLVANRMLRIVRPSQTPTRRDSKSQGVPGFAEAVFAATGARGLHLQRSAEHSGAVLQHMGAVGQVQGTQSAAAPHASAHSQKNNLPQHLSKTDSFWVPASAALAARRRVRRLRRREDTPPLNFRMFAHKSKSSLPSLSSFGSTPNSKSSKVHERKLLNSGIGTRWSDQESSATGNGSDDEGIETITGGGRRTRSEREGSSTREAKSRESATPIGARISDSGALRRAVGDLQTAAVDPSKLPPLPGAGAPAAAGGSNGNKSNKPQKARSRRNKKRQSSKGSNDHHLDPLDIAMRSQDDLTGAQDHPQGTTPSSGQSDSDYERRASARHKESDTDGVSGYSSHGGSSGRGGGSGLGSDKEDSSLYSKSHTNTGGTHGGDNATRPNHELHPEGPDGSSYAERGSMRGKCHSSDGMNEGDTYGTHIGRDTGHGEKKTLSMTMPHISDSRPTTVPQKASRRPADVALDLLRQPLGTLLAAAPPGGTRTHPDAGPPAWTRLETSRVLWDPIETPSFAVQPVLSWMGTNPTHEKGGFAVECQVILPVEQQQGASAASMLEVVLPAEHVPLGCSSQSRGDSLVLWGECGMDSLLRAVWHLGVQLSRHGGLQAIRPCHIVTVLTRVVCLGIRPPSMKLNVIESGVQGYSSKTLVIAGAVHRQYANSGPDTLLLPEAFASTICHPFVAAFQQTSFRPGRVALTAECMAGREDGDGIQFRPRLPRPYVATSALHSGRITVRSRERAAGLAGLLKAASSFAHVRMAEDPTTGRRTVRVVVALADSMQDTPKLPLFALTFVIRKGAPLTRRWALLPEQQTLRNAQHQASKQVDLMHKLAKAARRAMIIRKTLSVLKSLAMQVRTSASNASDDATDKQAANKPSTQAAHTQITDSPAGGADLPAHASKSNATGSAPETRSDAIGDQARRDTQPRTVAPRDERRTAPETRGEVAGDQARRDTLEQRSSARQTEDIDWRNSKLVSKSKSGQVQLQRQLRKLRQMDFSDDKIASWPPVALQYMLPWRQYFDGVSRKLHMHRQDYEDGMDQMKRAGRRVVAAEEKDAMESLQLTSLDLDENGDIQFQAFRGILGHPRGNHSTKNKASPSERRSSVLRRGMRRSKGGTTRIVSDSDSDSTVGSTPSSGYESPHKIRMKATAQWASLASGNFMHTTDDKMHPPVGKMKQVLRRVEAYVAAAPDGISRLRLRRMALREFAASCSSSDVIPLTGNCTVDVNPWSDGWRLFRLAPRRLDAKPVIFVRAFGNRVDEDRRTFTLLASTISLPTLDDHEWKSVPVGAKAGMLRFSPEDDGYINPMDAPLLGGAKSYFISVHTSDPSRPFKLKVEQWSSPPRDEFGDPIDFGSKVDEEVSAMNVAAGTRLRSSQSKRSSSRPMTAEDALAATTTLSPEEQERLLRPEGDQRQRWERIVRQVSLLDAHLQQIGRAVNVQLGTAADVAAASSQGIAQEGTAVEVTYDSESTTDSNSSGSDREDRAAISMLEDEDGYQARRERRVTRRHHRRAMQRLRANTTEGNLHRLKMIIRATARLHRWAEGGTDPPGAGERSIVGEVEHCAIDLGRILDGATTRVDGLARRAGLVEDMLEEIRKASIATSRLEGIHPWETDGQFPGPKSLEAGNTYSDTDSNSDSNTPASSMRPRSDDHRAVRADSTSDVTGLGTRHSGTSSPAPVDHERMALQRLLIVEQRTQALRDSASTFAAARAATMLEPEYSVEVKPTDELFLPHFALGIGLDDGIEHMMTEGDTIAVDNVGILSRVQDRVQQMMQKVEDQLAFKGMDSAGDLRTVQSIEVRRMAQHEQRKRLTLLAARVRGADLPERFGQQLPISRQSGPELVDSNSSIGRTGLADMSSSVVDIGEAPQKWSMTGLVTKSKGRQVDYRKHPRLPTDVAIASRRKDARTRKQGLRHLKRSIRLGRKSIKQSRADLNQATITQTRVLRDRTPVLEYSDGLHEFDIRNELIGVVESSQSHARVPETRGSIPRTQVGHMAPKNRSSVSSKDVDLPQPRYIASLSGVTPMSFEEYKRAVTPGFLRMMRKWEPVSDSLDGRHPLLPPLGARVEAVRTGDGTAYDQIINTPRTSQSIGYTSTPQLLAPPVKKPSPKHHSDSRRQRKLRKRQAKRAKLRLGPTTADVLEHARTMRLVMGQPNE